MTADKQFLEAILQRYDHENSVHSVVSVNSGAASAQGDNYSSSVLRVKVDVILNSGRKKRKSVIIKRLPEGQEETVKWLKRFGVFRREVEVMGTILPGMESLMEEFNDTRDVFWPKLIHHTPYSEVIIEDLKVYGYELANRQKGFSLSQSEMVMEYTGRFHAMSVVLVERGVLDPAGHVEHVLPHSPDMIKNYMQAATSTIVKIILRDWGPQWRDIGLRLKEVIHRIPGEMEKFGRRDDNRFNVLNHGDLWAPNILFKYGKDTENPLSLRIIDYQMTFYTTYAFDLNHFLYSSISHEVRLKNFDHLLKIYHKSLYETCKLYEYDMKKVPSYEDVLNEMENTSFFALMAVSMIMCVIMSDPKDAVDFEALIKPKPDIVDMNENIFNNKEFENCLKDCLLKFSAKGVF